MRRSRTLATTALAGSLLATLLAVPAGAEDVTATFTVPEGALSIVTDDVDKTVSLTLDSSLIGGATARGTLGKMTVSDSRTTSTGWAVSVSSTDFVSGTNTVPATAAKLYVLTTNGPTIVSGVVAPTTTHIDATTGRALSTTAASFMTATATGANEVTYTPTLDVTLASNTAPGTYSGKITQTAA